MYYFVRIRIGSVLLLLTALFSLGCGESVVADKGSVVGVVKVNGKPLKFGRIVFYTRDNIAGKTDVRDGQFNLPLDATGEVRICFVDFRLSGMQIEMANPNISKDVIPSEFRNLPKNMSPEEAMKMMEQMKKGETPTGPDGQPILQGVPPMEGDPRYVERMMERLGAFAQASPQERAEYRRVLRKYRPKGTAKPLVRNVEAGQKIELSLEI